MEEDLLLSSYTYTLPESCIAQQPKLPEHNAKLMICSLQATGDLLYEDQIFADLPNYLDQHYMLFLNSTKVFKARIPLHNTKIRRKTGQELLLETGELLIYAIHSKTQFECLVSDNKNFRPGSQIFFREGVVFRSLEFTANGILFEISSENPSETSVQIFDFLEKKGEMPLPPYIRYEKEKEKRYQTFFAEKLGSAAAPTASLHFTPELVKRLEKKGVEFQFPCLHVGLGTFKPVYEEHIQQQKLHFEPMILESDIRKTIADAKLAGKRFLPIGTTMIRYLESLPYIRRFLKKKNLNIAVDYATKDRRDQLTKTIDEKLVEEFIPEQEVCVERTQFSSIPEKMIIQTRLFIRPGIPFLLTDELITNFHLPKSSLMILISAFIGRKNLLEAYQRAIQAGYKFYSFWDGMRIKKQTDQ